MNNALSSHVNTEGDQTWTNYSAAPLYLHKLVKTREDLHSYRRKLGTTARTRLSAMESQMKHFLCSKFGFPSKHCATLVRQTLAYQIPSLTIGLLYEFTCHLDTLGDWKMAELVLCYHTQELTEMRSRAESHVQRLFVTYIYLRDLQHSNYISEAMRDRDYWTAQGAYQCCDHCGGSALVHPPDEVCLWRQKSKPEAVKVRGKALSEA